MTNGPIIRQRAPLQPAGHQNAGGAIIQNRTGIQPVGAHGAPAHAPTGTAQPAGIMGYDQIKANHERETQRAQAKQQERENGYMPMRFYLPSPKKAKSPDELQASIIVLDQAPSFAMYEHGFPDPQTGRWGRGSFTVPCLTGESHCPACDKDQKDPYYALFLSIIDMRGYVTQQGVQVPWSRKLLVVKNKNQGWWFRQFERRGTLRGMQVQMVRDAGDPNGANHGNPEFIDLHPEEAIIQSFAHPQRLSQDGLRVVKQENEDCYPYDYAALFPKPSYDEMVQRFGGTPAAGSGPDAANTWGADHSQFASLNRGVAATIGRTIQPIGMRAAAPAAASNYQAGDGNEIDEDEVPFEEGTGAAAAPASAPITAARTIVGTRDPNTIPL